jgi:hypothetical protein
MWNSQGDPAVFIAVTASFVNNFFYTKLARAKLSLTSTAFLKFMHNIKWLQYNGPAR